MTEGSTPPDLSEGGLRVGVAVPAAGSGRRMGGVQKPFLELAGEPVLVHALRPFLSDPRVVSIVVAFPPEVATDPPSWLLELDTRIEVVAGGATRTDSVRNALAALPDVLDVIAVHDAARPLVMPETVRACIDRAAHGVGAVAGCPAVDTLKRVDGAGRIVETPDRSSFWHAHTPQVFPAAGLRAAYQGGAGGTDDSALYEAAGGRVEMVDGGPTNLKVTRPGDVALAEAILAARGDA